MERAHPLSLEEAIAEELTHQGTEPEAAQRLAGEAVSRYPLISRVGLEGGVCEARRAGMSELAAVESTLWLAAWESLRRGRSYAATLDLIERSGGDAQRARAAVLEASAFLRRHDTARTPGEGAKPEPIGARTARAILILLAAAGWVALGGRWLTALG